MTASRAASAYHPVPVTKLKRPLAAVAVLVLVGTVTASVSTAAQPKWTVAKVEKKLRASRILCPRSIYNGLAHSGSTFCNPNAPINPKYGQTIKCGVTPSCDFGPCCHDSPMPVTERDLKFAHWWYDNAHLGQPIAWAKCARAGPRKFMCGVQLLEIEEFLGVPVSTSGGHLERFCLAVTTSPSFKWKATAALWEPFYKGDPTQLVWKPSDPGACGQMAVRP